MDDYIVDLIISSYDAELEGYEHPGSSHYRSKSSYTPTSEYKAIVLNETQKAWYVEIEWLSTKKSKCWLPKSQCKIKNGIISIPNWLIAKKDKERREVDVF
jgi:hypothetical protein